MNQTQNVDSNRQLNANDALRIASSDERFAKIFLKIPHNFKNAFNLKVSDLDAISQASMIEPLSDALVKVEELLRTPPPATEDEDVEAVRLDASDALRLAEMNDKFADGFLSCPEDFKEAFNLEASDFDAISQASGVESLADALAKVRELISAAPPPTYGEEPRLDVTDALRLAEINETFASGFLSAPESFKDAFALKASELEVISQASKIEEVKEALS